MDNKDYLALVDELKAGKESAFDYLFRRYYKDLCRFAYSFLNDRMLAEDVVQGVFEKIWMGKKFIVPRMELDNYLYISVRNSCYTLLKERVERVDLEKAEQEEVVLSELPGEHAGLSILKEKIEELPLQCRVVFKLVVWEEMKYRDVALRLGVSVNTVKTQMKIAYKILRFKLRPYHSLFLVFYLCRHFLTRS